MRHRSSKTVGQKTREIRMRIFQNAYIFTEGKIMKQGLNIVTMVLGAIVAAAGIATAVLSIINLGVSRKYLD